MAIFKKTTEKKTPAVKAEKKTAKKSEAKVGAATGALVRPHVTEKAALLAEKNVYVFKIAQSTNKIEIAKEVALVYGVTPVSVNIINLPTTRVFVRGKKGVKSGVRKALVTLKKGDKIELI